MKKVFLVTIMAIFVGGVCAQNQDVYYSFENPDFGEFSEMKDVTKVCIKSDNLDARQIIAQRLNKDTTLEVVNKGEGCTAVAIFDIQAQNTGSTYMMGTLTRDQAVVGRLVIAMLIPPKEGSTQGRIRIVWNKTKVQNITGGLTFDKNPASSTAGSFIKDWKKMTRSKKSK